jgi:hypothetical protein
MSAGKEQHVASDAFEMLQEPGFASGDVSRRLTLRASVAKEIPAGTAGLNFGRELPFIQAVIPLDKVGTDLCPGNRIPPIRRCASRGREWHEPLPASHLLNEQI